MAPSSANHNHVPIHLYGNHCESSAERSQTPEISGYNFKLSMPKNANGSMEKYPENQFRHNASAVKSSRINSKFLIDQLISKE